MIKILLDENVAVSLKKKLEEHGYDVIHINDIETGMPDPQVYQIAKSENRIIISADNHFKQNKLELNEGSIFITPTVRGCVDLFERIDWIIKKALDYNMNLLECTTIISKDRYTFRYKKGLKGEIKEKEIDLKKTSFYKQKETKKK